jgi:hypothetical protein
VRSRQIHFSKSSPWLTDPLLLPLLLLQVGRDRCRHQDRLLWCLRLWYVLSLATYQLRGQNSTPLSVSSSDLHTMSSGWGEVDYPQVVGHEIVGRAVRVGSQVKDIKVGDLVGVGAQNDSCLECGQCKASKEPYCDNGIVGTYGGKYKKGNGKGDKSFGGYASYHRVRSFFNYPLFEADVLPVLILY